MEEKKTFRWWEFSVYGEKGSPTQKKVESELIKVYSGLFKIMGHATGKNFSLDDMIQFAKKQGRERENGTLADVLKKNYGISELDVKEDEKKDKNSKNLVDEERKKSIRDNKEAKRKAIADKAKVKLDEMVESGELTPAEGKILESYLQSYTAYGTGARDNVVTSATLLSVGSLNARIGCGQGKTDISKAFAMAKAVDEKRPVITSSTPELAVQSFDELYNGLNQSKLNVIYLSNDEISYALGEVDEDGKFVKHTRKTSEMTPEEIKALLAKSNVIISDLSTLVQFKENGIYEPNREEDVLLQDEQDADIFNNLWDIEIKGDAYDKETHDKRLVARKEAARIVASLGSKLAGDKIAQAVTIDDKAPNFKVNGDTISIDGTDVSFHIPEGISAMEMQEFVLDAMYASKVFGESGKDYVVKDGIVEAISPSTGAREDIPEGILQAIAVNEYAKGTISKIQPELVVKSVVSKLAFMKESFGQINGMSATYGIMGSDVSKDFLDLLTAEGVSPELIPVPEIYKSKGKIPNFENIKEGEPPEEMLTIADEDAALGSVVVTIGGEKVVKDNIPPHIAAIIRDIENNSGKAIIIATNDRAKTEELTKALSEIYGVDRIAGYSGVPDKKGNPKLNPPPNPAKDEKLDITPPKIVIGDHAIGRGVTPENNSKVEEHLIVAQMPSRSEALLEQFLGRVGRKDNDGSVAFVLSNQDEIVTEYAEKTGELPTRASEIIDNVYQEKTRHAITSTKSDIELSRTMAKTQFDVIRRLLYEGVYPDKDPSDLSFEELELIQEALEKPSAMQKLLEENPRCLDLLEEGARVAQDMMKLYSKQYKMDPMSLSARSASLTADIVKETIERIQDREQSKEPEIADDMGKEILEFTRDSRYSSIVQKITRAKELQSIYRQEVVQKKDDDLTK